MSESMTCVSRDFSVTECKKTLTTFIYTWKIKNFRDICQENYYELLSSESSTSDRDNKKTRLWSVKLYLVVYPGYDRYCGLYKDYFSVIINFKYTDYDYFSLKVSIIDASKIEKEVYCSSKLKSFTIDIPQLVKKNLVLSEESQLLPDGDLTLKFQITFTKSELLSNNLNSGNFSNMPIFTGSESMFNNEKFSDVKIVVGDKIFYMHKVILAAQSPVFAAMFEHYMKENIENVVEIADIDHKIMHELLYFIYSGKVNNIDDVALDLLCAADKYKIEELQSTCQQTLIKQLQVENVIALLIFAEKYGAELLKESAIQYFTIHLKEIIQTEDFEKELKNFVHLMPDIFKSLAY